jgi:hypothetical protein
VASQFKGGFYPAAYGRENVLMINPITPEHPAAIEARLQVPVMPHPRLYIEVASDGQHGDFLMKAFINNRLVKDVIVDTRGEFVTEVVEMDATSGSTVDVRLEFHAKDWAVNAAYVRAVSIK